MRIIQIVQEPPRIRLTDFVFAYFQNNSGDPIATDDLPLQPFYAYLEKLSAFAQAHREETIEWLAGQELQLPLYQKRDLEYLRNPIKGINWSHYAHLFQVPEIQARAQGLLDQDTYPLLIALTFAKKNGLEPPFDPAQASIPLVEVHEQHLFHLNWRK